MKQLFAATCVAAAMAVGLSAPVAQGHVTQGQAQAPAQEARDTKTVTVTGCLRTGEEPNTFVLANVRWGEKGKDHGTAVADRSGTTGTDAVAPQRVRLIGAPPDLQLNEHVGHTIEVTGTLDTVKDRPAGQPVTTGDTTMRREAEARETRDRTLEVRTVRMISSTCPM